MDNDRMTALSSSHPKSGCFSIEAMDIVEVERVLDERPNLRNLMKEAKIELLRLMPDAEIRISCDGAPDFRILVMTVGSAGLTSDQVFDTVERFADDFHRWESASGMPILIVPEC
jgi:arginase family enzyme